MFRCCYYYRIYEQSYFKTRYTTQNNPFLNFIYYDIYQWKLPFSYIRLYQAETSYLVLSCISELIQTKYSY